MRLEKVSLGSFKVAKGHYGGWHFRGSPSPLSLTSLQINACAGTHSATPLSFPPNNKASIPWDPKGKKTTLRATTWKWWRRSQEPGRQTERSMELLYLVLTHGLTPFMTFGHCFLSPEVSASPICQAEGSTVPRIPRWAPRHPWRVPEQAGGPPGQTENREAGSMKKKPSSLVITYRLSLGQGHTSCWAPRRLLYKTCSLTPDISPLQVLETSPRDQMRNVVGTRWSQKVCGFCFWIQHLT